MEYDNTRRGQIDICNSPRPYTAAQTLRQNNILRIYIMTIFECSRERSLIKGPNNWGGRPQQRSSGKTRATHCDLLSNGGGKDSLSFFPLTLFFGGLGCKCKVQKVSNFFWGEDFGNINHWDSAFPNSRQAPTHNQTCSRLPINPISSILGPCPVPLLVLLSHACFTFHRETEGQTIEIIKTLQTPAEYIRLARNIQHVHHFLFQGPAPRHWLSPHTYLNVYMFVCLYVHMFLRELQILDIRHWMANTSRHHDTENQK